MTAIILVVLQIVLALIPFIAEGVRAQRAKKPKETADENVQAAREALANDDGAGFAAHAADQHDRIRGQINGGK